VRFAGVTGRASPARGGQMGMTTAYLADRAVAAAGGGDPDGRRVQLHALFAQLFI